MARITVRPTKSNGKATPVELLPRVNAAILRARTPVMGAVRGKEKPSGYNAEVMNDGNSIDVGGAEPPPG